MTLNHKCPNCGRKETYDDSYGEYHCKREDCRLIIVNKLRIKSLSEDELIWLHSELRTELINRRNS